jgi:hypothetical protein
MEEVSITAHSESDWHWLPVIIHPARDPNPIENLTLWLSAVPVSWQFAGNYGGNAPATNATKLSRIAISLTFLPFQFCILVILSLHLCVKRSGMRIHLHATLEPIYLKRKMNITPFMC